MTLRSSIVFATPAFLPLIELAQRAEALGYHRVWTTETPGRDAMVRALTLGLRTSTIQVATGIAYAFTRAPLGMAATAADTHAATGGRFSLGIGAGTQGMRRRWYGIEDFDHPATRLAEYATLMRAAWAAEQDLRHDGRFYRASYDQLDGSRASVPLWGSGINPTMLTVAARHFDGVALHALASHVAYLDRVALPAIAAGASTAARRPELAVWRLTAIDDDGDAARARARQSLAFYFSTPSYGAVADQTGWGEVAARVRAAYAADGPRWDHHAGLVPDEMVAEFALAGTPHQVLDARDALHAALAQRGVSEVVYQTVSVGDSQSAAVAGVRTLVEVVAPAGADGRAKAHR